MPRHRPRDSQRMRVIMAFSGMDVKGWHQWRCHQDMIDYMQTVCSNPWVQQDFGKQCCKLTYQAYAEPTARITDINLKAKNRWKVACNEIMVLWILAYSMVSYTWAEHRTQLHGKEFTWTFLRLVKHTQHQGVYWLLQALYTKHNVRVLKPDLNHLPWKVLMRREAIYRLKGYK